MRKDSLMVFPTLESIFQSVMRLIITNSGNMGLSDIIGNKVSNFLWKFVLKINTCTDK